MSWDQGYKSPDEKDAERQAALDVQARAKLSQFERRQLDYLGEISASLQLIAKFLTTTPPIPGTSGSAGDGAAASAESVDGHGPGSARPGEFRYCNQERPDGLGEVHACDLLPGHDDEHKCFCGEIWPQTQTQQ